VNSLNSVLLEGVITTNPEYKKSINNMLIGTFTLKSTRFYKNNDETVKEFCHFNIVMNGNLADDMKEFLTTDKSVRVVGRLNEKSGSITIIADHIEFKKG